MCRKVGIYWTTFFLMFILIMGIVLPVADIAENDFLSPVTVSNTEVLDKTVSYETHAPIVIIGDDNFNDTAFSEGWPGNGTAQNPFIIEGLEIDQGGSTSSCISISNTRVNFTIQNCNLTGTISPGRGIMLDNVYFGKILNNIFDDNDYNIYIWACHYLLVKDNTCPNSYYSISIRQGSSYNTITDNDCPYNTNRGINLESGSHHNTVANNTCNNNNFGIVLYLVNYNEVVNNTFNSNVDQGIHVNNAHFNTFVNNTCNDNYDDVLFSSGIYLFAGSHDNNLNNNTCNGNSIGIYIDSSNDNNLTHNICNNNLEYDNTMGIVLWNANSSTLTNNTCTNNHAGIILFESSFISVIWNVFEGNFQNGNDVDGVSNLFDYNYWSDYTGFDANGDSIGDTPYLISGSTSNQDSHPLMLPPGSPLCWLSPPNDHVISWGMAFRYDLNATASGGLDHWWLNDTLNFEIDQFGVVSNLTILHQGTLGLQIIVNDTYGNELMGFFTVNVIGLHSPIIITDDAHFDVRALAEGWSGNGTSSSPYVIENTAINRNGELGHCVSISNTRSCFVIKNCDLVGANSSLGAGIYLNNVTNGVLIDNTCSNNQRGIWLASSSNIFVNENTCTSNVYGIYLEASANNTIVRNNCPDNINRGVCLEQGSNLNTVVNNTCTNMVFGIVLYLSHSNNVTGNNCTSNSNDGIHVNNGWHNNLTYNLCNYNGRYGLYLFEGSSFNTLANNTCNNNDKDGIYQESSSSNSFFKNICNYNKYSGIFIVGITTAGALANNTCNHNIAFGIYIAMTYNLVVTHNICNNNGFGIIVELGSDNSITWNSFSDNTVADGYSEGWNEFFDYNYWSDYTGEDADQDGIGDTPYLLWRTEPIAPLSQDFHPLLVPHNSIAWIPVPIDHFLEVGDSFRYDLNATHYSSLGSWWLNDTAHFAIDDEGIITTIGIVPVGAYGIQVWVNNTWGTIHSGSFTVTFVDTTPPSWIDHPVNQYLEYGELFDYQLTASDLSGVNHWILNDTQNFFISPTGRITNRVVLQPGIYGLLVNVLDLYGNPLSSEFTIFVAVVTTSTTTTTTTTTSTTRSPPPDGIDPVMTFVLGAGIGAASVLIIVVVHIKKRS